MNDKDQGQGRQHSIDRAGSRSRGYVFAELVEIRAGKQEQVNGKRDYAPVAGHGSFFLAFGNCRVPLKVDLELFHQPDSSLFVGLFLPGS